MFVCEEHQELWNRDTGCSYCRYRTLEQQLAEQVANTDIILSAGEAVIEKALKQEQQLAAEQENAQGFHDHLTELEAELADTVTECLAAKSNEDIMRKQLSPLREAAQAEVERQRHLCGILRQELPPTTAALAALLHGDGNE